MKLKMVVATLVFGMAFCSSSYGHDLLNRMMGRSGCGGCATSCCDTPVDAGCGCNSGCGGLNFDAHVRFSLSCPKFGNFFNRGCCGGGLLGGMGHGCCDSGCDTGCNTGCDTGCGAADAGCGCDGGLIGHGCGGGCGGGLLRGLFHRHGCCGGGLFGGGLLSGCGGCGSIVDAGCGCNSGCGGAMADAGCGCNAGPVCGGGCHFRGFGLLDRIKNLGCCQPAGCGGCGAVDAGCGCNSGCGSVVGSGCGCNGGGTHASPVPAAAPTEAAPQVIEPEAAPQGAEDGSTYNAPIVDPNAFIVPNRRIAGGAR